MKALPQNIIELLQVDEKNNKFAVVSGIDRTKVTLDLKDSQSFANERDDDRTHYVLEQKLYFNDAGEVIEIKEPKAPSVKTTRTGTGSLATKIPY